VQHDARPQRDKGNDPSAAGIGIGDRVEVEPGALSRIAGPRRQGAGHRAKVGRTEPHLGAGGEFQIL